MRNFIFIVFSLISVISLNAQSKSDLKKEVSSLKMEIKKLNLYIEDLENQITILQSGKKDTYTEESLPDTCAVK